MTIGQFLKFKREEAQLSQSQLSYKTGLSTSGIFRIENDERKPSPETLDKYATLFSLNKVMLLELAGYISKDDIQEYTIPIINLKIKEEIENISSTNQTTIPVYSSVSAGLGRVAESTPIDYLSLPIKCSESCVGIKVSGDSMSPTITDGAIIILKKEIEVLDREIGVFLLNDEAYVKRIIRKDKLLLLYSDNFLYEPIIVTEKDNFVICGKVIETLNKL